MNRRVQLRLKGLVEVMGADQKYHIAEVVIAPRRQFELNQLWQRDDLDLLDLLADIVRIREGERPRFPCAWITAGDKAVDGHAALPLDEAPRTPLDLLIHLADELLAKAL